MKNNFEIELKACLTIDEYTARRALAIVNMYLEDTHIKPTIEECNHGGELNFYRILI